MLVSGVLAIVFGYMITNHVMQKSYQEFPVLSTVERKLSFGHSSINEKDINDMVLSGLDVQSVIESNTYSGLEAKLKFTTWKKI